MFFGFSASLMYSKLTVCSFTFLENVSVQKSNESFGAKLFQVRYDSFKAQNYKFL